MLYFHDGSMAISDDWPVKNIFLGEFDKKSRDVC